MFISSSHSNYCDSFKIKVRPHYFVLKILPYSKSQRHYNSLQSPTKLGSFSISALDNFPACTLLSIHPGLHAILWTCQTYSHYLCRLFVMPGTSLQMSALLSPCGRSLWLPNIPCFKRVFVTPLGCMTDLANERNRLIYASPKNQKL